MPSRYDRRPTGSGLAGSGRERRAAASRDCLHVPSASPWGSRGRLRVSPDGARVPFVRAVSGTERTEPAVGPGRRVRRGTARRRPRDSPHPRRGAPHPGGTRPTGAVARGWLRDHRLLHERQCHAGRVRAVVTAVRRRPGRRRRKSRDPCRRRGHRSPGLAGRAVGRLRRRRWTAAWSASTATRVARSFPLRRRTSPGGSRSSRPRRSWVAMRGAWWAPDSGSLLVARVDNSPVGVWHIADPARPENPPYEHRYPAAGTANAHVSLWHIGLDGSVPRCLGTTTSCPTSSTSPGWPTTRRSCCSWTARSSASSCSPSKIRRSRANTSRSPTRHWVDVVPGTPCWWGERVLTVEVHADTYRLFADGAALTPEGLQVRAVARRGRRCGTRPRRRGPHRAAARTSSPTTRSQRSAKACPSRVAVAGPPSYAARPSTAPAQRSRSPDRRNDGTADRRCWPSSPR